MKGIRPIFRLIFRYILRAAHEHQLCAFVWVPEHVFFASKRTWTNFLNKTKLNTNIFESYWLSSIWQFGYSRMLTRSFERAISSDYLDEIPNLNGLGLNEKFGPEVRDVGGAQLFSISSEPNLPDLNAHVILKLPQQAWTWPLSNVNRNRFDFETLTRTLILGRPTFRIEHGLVSWAALDSFHIIDEMAERYHSSSRRSVLLLLLIKQNVGMTSSIIITIISKAKKL